MLPNINYNVDDKLQFAALNYHKKINIKLPYTDKSSIKF